MDTFTGTSGNDTFIALDNGVAGETTLTLGDSLNGGAGADTLKIFSENDNLSLTKVNVSNIEHLVVVNSLNDWDDFDVAGRSFQTITLDVGGLESGGLNVVNINADTAVTLTNIYADGESNFINWKTDNTSTTGNTSLTVSKIDTSGGYSEDVYSYATFTKATTVNTVINVADITDGEDDGYYFYGEHVLNTGTTKGVAVNTTINVSNVEAPDYAAQYFYVEQAGDSVNNFTVNLTNTTNFDIYLELDDNDNGSSKTDVVTYNLTNVKNDNDGTWGGQAYLGSNGFETINVNVLSKSSLEEIYDNYGNGNNQVLNVVAAADLSVERVYLDDANVTVNVSGAGNVDLGTLYAGDGDADDVVTVDASALTGNFKVYDSNGYAASITSGSGNDTIKVGSNKTSVNAGNGDNLIDIGGYNYTAMGAGTLAVGSGVDTLKMTAANADAMDNDTTFNGKVTGFERLWLESATNQTLNLSNLGGLTSYVTLEGNGNTLTLNNLANGATVVMRDASIATALNIKDAGTGTADVLNLRLNGNATTVNFGAVTAASVETVNIVSTTRQEDPTTVTNTAALSATAHTTLNISGDAELDIDGVALTSVKTVNAAGFDAGLTISLAGNANDTTITVGAGNNSITGGGGKDTITITGGGDNYVDGGAGNDTIVITGAGDNYVMGGAGNDTITLGHGDNYVEGGDGNDTIVVGNGDNEIYGGAGNDAITVGNGDNEVTGGLGADTITLGTGANTVYYGVAADSSGLNIDTIINFKAGNLGTEAAPKYNVFDFTGVLSDEGLAGNIVFLGNFSSITAANTALQSGTTDLQIVFVSADNAIYVDINDDGVINTGDMAINLVGMTGTLIDANFGL